MEKWASKTYVEVYKEHEKKEYIYLVTGLKND